MSLLKKGYIVTWYIRTHIYLGMIELHADFSFSMARQV